MITRLYVNNYRCLVAFNMNFDSLEVLWSEFTDDNQVILISHNSEILDSNPSKGIFLWRDNHRSPTRAGTLDTPNRMSAGEALARGWCFGM